MPKIFDDDKAEYKVYETALKIWEKSADPDERSMAINLRCDHRVSSRREKIFRDYVTTFPDDMRQALGEYFVERIKDPSAPDFCLTDCNNLRDSCLKGSGVCCSGLKPTECLGCTTKDLSTVFNLNGMLESFKEAKHILSGEPEWNELFSLGFKYEMLESKEFGKWLDTLFDKRLGKITLLESSGGSESEIDKIWSEIENILRIFFGILNKLMDKNRRYKPVVWVTDWSLFSKYTGETVNRWSQVVGVDCSTYDRWQIVLKYPLDKVKALYSPTQLDANFYPQHFPVPPQMPVSNGGHAMDLVNMDDRLLTEYIHQPIKLEIDFCHVKADRSGKLRPLIGKTTLFPMKLETLRKLQYKKLKKRYDPLDKGLIEKWMPKPI